MARKVKCMKCGEMALYKSRRQFTRKDKSVIVQDDYIHEIAVAVDMPIPIRRIIKFCSFTVSDK